MLFVGTGDPERLFGSALTGLGDALKLPVRRVQPQGLLQSALAGSQSSLGPYQNALMLFEATVRL